MIGLFISEKIRRDFPYRYKLKILARPGTLQEEDDSNRQINDKERIAAAIEKEAMKKLVEECIAYE